MRMFALATLVIAACASGTPMTSGLTSGPDTRFERLQQVIQRVDAGEQACINGETTRTSRQLARIAGTPDATTGRQIQMLTDDRDRRILECQARADRQREKLTSEDRAEYQIRAHEGPNSLMMILTASRPR